MHAKTQVLVLRWNESIRIRESLGDRVTPIHAPNVLDWNKRAPRSFVREITKEYNALTNFIEITTLGTAPVTSHPPVPKNEEATEYVRDRLGAMIHEAVSPQDLATRLSTMAREMFARYGPQPQYTSTGMSKRKSTTAGVNKPQFTSAGASNPQSTSAGLGAPWHAEAVLTFPVDKNETAYTLD